jgi:hypothetical protein
VNPVICFFNGAEGDLSVGHKRNQSAVGVIAPFRTFEKAQELGARVVDAVIAKLTQVSDQEPVLRVGEVFVAIALEIRRRSSFPITMFFGLANNYIGYIPRLGDKGEGYEIVA